MNKNFIPIFHHPFTLIISAPSTSGKSTLAFNIVKDSDKLVSNTDCKGFDRVLIIYRSFQSLYDKIKRELKIPVLLFEKHITDDIENHIEGAQRPLLIYDDGISKENALFVQDLFTRISHHLNISVMLLNQTIYDPNCPTLRICHKNSRGLIIFRCIRDQSSLRTLLYQMYSNRKQAQTILQSIQKELEKPFNYVHFDFHPLCPENQRIKTNLLCETGPYPIALVYK